MGAEEVIHTLMVTPKVLTMPEQVAVGREMVKHLGMKGLSNKEAYLFLESMKKTFDRAIWRLKDDAFHASEDAAIILRPDDSDKEY